MVHGIKQPCRYPRISSQLRVCSDWWRSGTGLVWTQNTAGNYIRPLHGLSATLSLSSLTCRLASCLILLTSENWVNETGKMNTGIEEKFVWGGIFVARSAIGQRVKTNSSWLFRAKEKDLPFNLGRVSQSTPSCRAADLLRLFWPVAKHYHSYPHMTSASI